MAAWYAYEALDQHAADLGPWTWEVPLKAAEPNPILEDGDESSCMKNPEEDD
jgi:hypothetical protein